MRLTIIRADNVVGVNGIFRRVDLSGLPPEIRAVQWDGQAGHVEYDDSTNVDIIGIEEFRSYIDLWTRAAPPPPKQKTSLELVFAAHARINAAYEAAIGSITSGYPANEIASWPKQEMEARAWLADNSTPTPWLDSAANTRGIAKDELVARVIAQADALAPIHGALSGKRQYLRDRINALANPTQKQLDEIQW